QIGHDWVDSPASLFSLIIPLMLVGMTIPESFAGERERHTLATLLASRLPDRAILFGKMAVSIAFGWGMTVFILLVALITVNIANAVHGDGGASFYSWQILLADLGLSLLLAVVVSGAGILISLRSATVQEAQQILMGAFMIPPMILGFILLALRDHIGPPPSWLDLTTGALIAAAVLALLAAVVTVAAMARFQRARLMLS
ncbi:MAG: ABC transporter permease, partial [Dehalococcoidia bacterium]|nr:ABC transporter permease [Dehalococcoidia bacterium]